VPEFVTFVLEGDIILSLRKHLAWSGYRDEQIVELRARSFDTRLPQDDVTWELQFQLYSRPTPSESATRLM
jgi:hypothetical protein